MIIDTTHDIKLLYLSKLESMHGFYQHIEQDQQRAICLCGRLKPSHRIEILQSLFPLFQQPCLLTGLYSEL